MHRRHFLQSVTAATAAGVGLSQTDAQTGGAFILPTTTFQPGNQHELPSWAFRCELNIPPVALPTKIGTYEEVTQAGAFGTDDSVPLGECFHGVAREWGETPEHWERYGCNSKLKGKEAWENKQKHFGTVDANDGGEAVSNWSGFQIKCYRLQVEEGMTRFREDAAFEGRFYGYAGMMPAPTLKMRLGEPVVVRYENQLEAEVSVHLHGGHSPSHSDGFPTFYVLQGKSRDYFYPNILPLYDELMGHQDTTPNTEPAKFVPDVGESQSTMWYHDHAMDATAYNVSKGLAGFALCFGEEELKLIRERKLPGYGPLSCQDETCVRYNGTAPDLKDFEDPKRPGFYKPEKEPYYNPFDLPIVIQDKVIDKDTGQIAYDLTGHDGYLGDTFFVNGVAWPRHEVRNRKYRIRILNGSNARVYRLRLMKAEDFWKAQKSGIHSLDENAALVDPGISGDFKNEYDRHSEPYLRIGKDSWLWSYPVEMRSHVLAMANRSDLVIDFCKLTKGLKPGEKQEFVLVNTMPQFDGRGPKPKLEDGGDPRVLPLPFDVEGGPNLVELSKPIGLMKFEVFYQPPGEAKTDPEGDRDACLEPVKFDNKGKPIPGTGTPLITKHRPILNDEIVTVREFIFERGKGAWQINGRFYDPFIANAAPRLNGAEEWVLRNGGGGWWHPIHIHLESHQLISYEKDFDADEVIDRNDPPARPMLDKLVPVEKNINEIELMGLHDTQVLGPNTVARIRMRHRTWYGPFVFHCHNLEHEDMRMMYNFEPVPDQEDQKHDPDVAPASRTHGNHVTLGGAPGQVEKNVGELEWEYAAIPKTPVRDAGEPVIPPRPNALPRTPNPQDQ